MTDKRTGLAVFGGTFDPVHEGHLQSAIAVRQALHARLVKMVPSYLPPHRSEPSTTPLHRVAMLELAITDVTGLEADQREVDRQGKSFTVDTLRSIRDEISPAEPLYFVLGVDAFCTVPEWHEWEALTDLAHLVVLTRPGYEMSLSEPFHAWTRDKVVSDPKCLASRPFGGICYLELTQVNISSTTIRGQLSRHEQPDNIPAGVLSYILEQHLYAE